MNILYPSNERVPLVPVLEDNESNNQGATRLLPLEDFHGQFTVLSLRDGSKHIFTFLLSASWTSNHLSDIHGPLEIC